VLFAVAELLVTVLHVVSEDGSAQAAQRMSEMNIEPSLGIAQSTPGSAAA